ncbi:MAG: amidohydrolase [Clostridia bacterium]|nr:amidohydrolase [Clostridia bacterium]
MRTLIKNAYMITMDEDEGVIENGSILIDGQCIESVGRQECFKDTSADRVIDAKGNAVLPGLINTHTHLPMTIFKGYGEGLPLHRWLSEKIWPAEEKLNEEIVYWSTLLGLCEMAKTGTTCFSDMYYLANGMFKAIQQSGYRGIIARGIMDIDGDASYKLKDAEEMYLNFHGKGNLEVMMSIHGEYTSSKDLFKKVLDLAEKYNTGIHIHVSETKEEHSGCIERHGVAPIQHLDKTGLTSRPIRAAHCVHVEDRDIEIMVEKDISVLSCPQSNLKLGSGIAPVKKMMDAGVNVSVATDGSSSNNNLDMIEEAMLIGMLQRGVNLDANAITNHEALRMATANGAKALGYENKLGKLRPGFLADIIMIDTDSLQFTPRHDIQSCIINSGSGRDVCMTMIGGKIVYENGKCTFADEREVRAKVQEFANIICS